MIDDLTPITREWNEKTNKITIYGVGDIHIGSAEFDEKAWNKKSEKILADDSAYIAIVGDLIDNGLKNSKTNVYAETMRPDTQIETAIEYLRPLRDRIICIVPGNHENRSRRECDINPAYVISAALGIDDLYRENLAIMILKFGETQFKRGQKNTYGGIAYHGSSRNKIQKFNLSFDNISFAISGHTHQGYMENSGRISVNLKAGTAKHVPFRNLVIDSNLGPGGYGLEKNYPITTPANILSGIVLNKIGHDKNKTIDTVSITV